MTLVKMVGGLAAVGTVFALTSLLWNYDQRLETLEQAVREGVLAERMPDANRSRGRRGARAGPSQGMPPGIGGAPLGFRDKRGSIGRTVDSELEPEVAEQMRGVIREERHELEQEQRGQYRAMFTERVESRMNRFAEEFDLPDGQREVLTNALISEIDTSMQLRSEVRSGEKSMNEVREAIRELRGQTSSQAQELLTEGQFDAFQEERRGPGPGGGGGRWRGR